MRWRIDDLALEAGTTSRNVRAYQARGLLPPPVLEGRTGWYGEEHLQRLKLIDELQGRGFSLESIRQILATWAQGGDLGHLLGFQALLTAPLSDEEPASTTLDDLLSRFPQAAERPELVDRAVALGLVEPQPDGGLLAPSPLVLEAGAELLSIGMSLEEILDLVEGIRADVADVARRFVDLAHEHLVASLSSRGDAPERFAEVVDVLRRLRPIAHEVVRAFLAQEMRRAIDAAATRYDEDLLGGPGGAVPV